MRIKHSAIAQMMTEVNAESLREAAEQTAHDRGYMHGLADERNLRSPEHSQSAYQFPRQASEGEQFNYNRGYYEAKRVYREIRNRIESQMEGRS